MMRLLFVLLGTLAVVSCTNEKQRSVNTIRKGLVVSMQEVDGNQFKIVNERLMGKETALYVQYTNQKVDTFDLASIDLVSYRANKGRAIQVAINGSLLQYYIGQPITSALNDKVYLDKTVYNKSQNLVVDLKKFMSTTTLK